MVRVGGVSWGYIEIGDVELFGVAEVEFERLSLDIGLVQVVWWREFGEGEGIFDECDKSSTVLGSVKS
jgi:hypothetical protein